MKLTIEITLIPSNRSEGCRLITENNKSATGSSDRKIVFENVCVGSGNSTIKWLSLMASHRMFSSKHRCRGMRLLPNNVYTHNQKFLHPDHVIRDVLSDGETIQVELCSQIQMSEACTPLYHPWCTIAFFTSNKERNELRKQLIKQLEEESLIHNQEKMKLLAKMQESINKPKILKMKYILKDQFLNADEVNSSMQREWELIVESGALDSIADTTAEKENIHQTLQDNFASLNHIYKYYSAVNSQGGTHTLEFIEFSKLINDAEILDSGDNTNMILTFFGSDIASEVKLWQFLLSFLRIAVYKYITLVKKQTRRPSTYFIKKQEEEEKKTKQQGTVELSKSLFSNKKESSSTVSNIPAKSGESNDGAAMMGGTVMSPSEAFLLLFQNHLKKLHDSSLSSSSSSSTAIKDILNSDECLLLLYDHLVSLGMIFCIYAKDPIDQHNPNEQQEQLQHSISTIGSVEDHVKEVGAMNIKQFSSFGSIFLEAPLITSSSSSTATINTATNDNCREKTAMEENKKKYVTMTDIRQVFSVSQNDKNQMSDSSKNTTGCGDGGEKESMAPTHNFLYGEDCCDQQFMEFPEFLESLIHLAMLLKEEDESIMQSISKILHKVEGHLNILTSTRRSSISIRRTTNHGTHN
jgi:hypothetical protein